MTFTSLIINGILQKLERQTCDLMLPQISLPFMSRDHNPSAISHIKKYKVNWQVLCTVTVQTLTYCLVQCPMVRVRHLVCASARTSYIYPLHSVFIDEILYIPAVCYLSCIMQNFVNKSLIQVNIDIRVVNFYTGFTSLWNGAKQYHQFILGPSG